MVREIAVKVIIGLDAANVITLNLYHSRKMSVICSDVLYVWPCTGK